MAAWWLMPAVTGAAMLVTRYKAAAGKVRWLEMTEDDAKKLPPALLIYRLESGDALPPAPAHMAWKSISMLVAVSPFAAPTDMELHVWEPMFAAPGVPPASPQVLPAGVQDLNYAFLTESEAYAHHPPPPTVEAVAPFQWVGNIGFGSSYLTTQEAETQTRASQARMMADLSSEAQQAMQALQQAMTESVPLLQQHGLSWIALWRPEEAREGDIVVLKDG